MKTTTAFPPNYRDIVDHLGDVSKARPLFCYGDTIYNPFKREITKDFEHHEYIHSIQQGENPEVWYYKYLRDPAFRLQQELEAYGEQYRLAILNKAPPQIRDWCLETLARELSNEAYGNLLTFNEAKSKIRNYVKHTPLKTT